MSITIERLPLGVIQTNCYILKNDETQEAIVIDPAAEAERILQAVGEYTVPVVLVTHAHWDHVLASGPVCEVSGAPLRLHQDALEQLQTMVPSAGSFGVSAPHAPPEPGAFIAHGDIITAAGVSLEARLTPGHAPGHLTFVLDAAQMAFVGDAIFKDGFGRTDFPGCSAEELRESIVNHILSLPDAYTLLSGHGEPTTVGREKGESPALAHLLNS